MMILMQAFDAKLHEHHARQVQAMIDTQDIVRLSLAGAYDPYDGVFQNHNIIPVTIGDHVRFPAALSGFAIRLPQPVHIVMRGAVAMAIKY